MSNINEFILSKGYNFKPENLDGSFHEFKTETGKGWYVGQVEGERIVLTFGDWVTGDKFTFKDGYHEGDEELLKIKRDQAKLAKIEAEEKVAPVLEEEFKNLVSVGPSPYLQKKKIKDLLGAKTKPSDTFGTDLVIPMHDINGKIWNIQYIQENGQKIYSKFGRTSGVFYVIGEIKDIIYITEGFATGASVHLATGKATVVSFSASNLTTTAKEFRKKYPSLPIVIARDDDHTNTVNTGKECAIQAATESSGSICAPDFGPRRGEGHTDWSDLFVIRGIDEVRKQLEQHIATPPLPGFRVNDGTQSKTESKKIKQSRSKSKARLSVAEHLKPWVNGIEPLPEKMSEGKIIAPTEFEVASTLYNYYRSTLLRQDQDLFHFTGTHWKLLGTPEIDRLKIQIQVLYAGLAKSSQLNSAFSQFIAMLDKSPQNLFESSPYRANFLNGTLHVIGNKLSFQPHNPLDYCTNVIPIEYDKTRSVRNEEFESMLNRIVGEGEERLEKIRAIKQMYGACLCPISPKLFLLWGQGGRGKSSVIIPAQRLVHKDNWSAVEPKDFKGFNMESMVGKLVNFVSDIDTTEPIDDANIKKIWDRMPIRVDRKNEKAINVPLPALHIFAGNDIPSTYEKSSGAHTRRWVFIELNNYVIGESYILDFANKAFDSSPQGVLNFALEGLEDLLASDFKYHSPESSKEKVREWELKHDQVGSFLKDISEFEVVGIVADKDGKIERPKLWEMFALWYKTANLRDTRMGRTNFYNYMRSRVGAEITVTGVRYFKGLRLMTSDEAARTRENLMATGVKGAGSEKNLHSY